MARNLDYYMARSVAKAIPGGIPSASIISEDTERGTYTVGMRVGGQLFVSEQFQGDRTGTRAVFTLASLPNV